MVDLKEWGQINQRTKSMISGLLVLCVALVIGWSLRTKSSCRGVDASSINGIIDSLTTEIYGQEIAIHAIAKTVENNYAGGDRNRKPMVLSFHGTAGTGKTLTANLLTDFTFGEQVYTFRKNREESSAEFKDYVIKTVDRALRRECPSVFIFDQMDNMPRGMGNLLRQFVEEESADYPRQNETVYILTSRLGGPEITKVALAYWLEGYRRNISLEELQDAILEASENPDEAGWHRRLIERGLITANIPFLPLDRASVKQCVLRQLFCIKGSNLLTEQDIKLSENVDVRNVIKSSEFFPSTYHVYDTRGCADLDKTIERVIRHV